jgi:hypothetical protein
MRTSASEAALEVAARSAHANRPRCQKLG